MTLTIKCDRCGGKVMEDIESHNFQDLHCIHCSKRWFIPKRKYRDFLNRLDKKYAKQDANRKVLLAA